MKVAILAGGMGTRLGLTDRPKPMAEVGGRPLLERLIDGAKASGFDDFVLLTGHLSDVIEAHFGDGSAFGVRIAYRREAAPLGTAGATLGARDLLTEPFLLLYGDTLIDVDLADMAAFHRTMGGSATLFVHPNDHPQDSDIVAVDKARRIVRLMPKPHGVHQLLPNLVSAALYILDPDVLDFVPGDGASDWVHDVFPRVLDSGRALYGYRSVEYVKDMGTPARLAKGEADLASGRVARLSRRQLKPAIFLDRDGVLNREIGGVHRPGDLHLTETAAQAVKHINDAGVPAICVTNQPDVAKGKMTTGDLLEVFAALDTGLGAGGAYLDDIYWCPHHPEQGWPGEVQALKIACDCRKPEPGMLLAAAATHRLDLARSWLIGDRPSDIAAAHAAGARAILLPPPADIAADAVAACQPDHRAETLVSAVNFALEQMS